MFFEIVNSFVQWTEFTHKYETTFDYHKCNLPLNSGLSSQPTVYAYLLPPHQHNSEKGGNSVGFLPGYSDWKILQKNKKYYILSSHNCPKAMLDFSPMYLSCTSSSFNLIGIQHCITFSVHKNTLPSCYDGIGYQEWFIIHLLLRLPFQDHYKLLLQTFHPI